MTALKRAAVLVSIALSTAILGCGTQQQRQPGAGQSGTADTTRDTLMPDTTRDTLAPDTTAQDTTPRDTIRM